jgi:hypothetical protein
MSRWDPDLAGNFGGDGKYDSFSALRKRLAERPLNTATGGVLRRKTRQGPNRGPYFDGAKI